MMELITENWIEIIGATVGLLYLYFEYRANIMMWPTGIIMSSLYTIVFVNAGFYAFAYINVYYIIAGIYGWIMWYKPKDDNRDMGIIRTPTRLYLPILTTIVIILGAVTYLLQEFTDSKVVYGDSFVTTLSVVAMIMLARKYVEQWILLIIVNAVSIFLYMHQGLYPTSVMYLIYSIVSVFGYLNWLKMIKNENRTII